jgi:transporter family protein|tara:strand:- start:61 stop:915 length:855 start_codon:yes stop_codon:yes gene_type:complete
MAAELFAIISAIFLACSGISVRIALSKKSSPFTALLPFAAGTVLVWLLVIVTGYELPNRTGALFFILRGILDPGIAPFLIYVALRKVGIVYTVPIIATYPLVSTTLSVIFLKENLTLFIAIGTLLIILGVILLNYKHTRNIVHLKYILWVVAGTILIGISTVITKFALNNSNTPVSGLAFSFTTGILLQILIITILRKWKDLRMGWETSRLFFLSGVFVSIGFMFGFIAFSQGDVVIIGPLASTLPLFSLLLSKIFLKKYEIVTKNAIIGTVFIVIGAAILTLI